MIVRVYISDTQSFRVALGGDGSVHEVLEAVALFCSLRHQGCAIDATRLCALVMVPPFDVSSSETIVLHSHASLSTLLPSLSERHKLYVLGIEAQQSRLRSRSLCRAPVSAPASPRSDTTAKQHERRQDEEEQSYGWFHADALTSSVRGLNKRNGKSSCDSLTSLSYSYDGNTASDVNPVPLLSQLPDKVVAVDEAIAAPPISYCSSSSDSDAVAPLQDAVQSGVSSVPVEPVTYPQDADEMASLCADTQPLPQPQVNEDDIETQDDKEPEEKECIAMEEQPMNGETSVSILDASATPSSTVAAPVDSTLTSAEAAVSTSSSPFDIAVPAVVAVSGIASPSFSVPPSHPAASVSASATSLASDEGDSSDSSDSSNSDSSDSSNSDSSSDSDDDSSDTSSSTSGEQDERSAVSAVGITISNSPHSDSNDSSESSADSSSDSSDEETVAPPTTPAVGQKRKQGPVNDTDALKALLFKPPPVKSPSHFLPSAMGTRSKSNVKKGAAALATPLPMKPPAKKTRIKKQQ